ncbi:MAG: PepSY-like domain-containing protein [Chitinophagaceae bacterium]
MKRIRTTLTIIALLIFAASSFAQLRKIPAEVTDAFKAKFPNSNAVEWKDKLKFFQASFEMRDEDYQAKFNSKGEWQETEKTIERDKLPTEVSDGFNKSKYSDWEVKEMSYIEKKDGTDQYRILVRKSDIEKKYLFFNKTGKLLKDPIKI